MQQTGQTVTFRDNGMAEAAPAATGGTGAGLERVETAMETLAGLHGTSESLGEVAHDARNMVTALELYCDLLEEPGVLNPAFNHYAHELRLVAASSRRLVEKLLVLDAHSDSRPDAQLDLPLDAWPQPENGFSGTMKTTMTKTAPRPAEHIRSWELTPARLIDNLSEELLANRNLLSALAGPSIALDVNTEDGEQAVRMSGEDLTRILVNLVKNAAEAMPGAGKIVMTLHEFHAEAEIPLWLMLTIEDNGPGIPCDSLGNIFDAGYTTKSIEAATNSGWAVSHRGLGLAITRSIVEAAGGHIHAVSRAGAGARFQIELPARSR